MDCIGPERPSSVDSVAYIDVYARGHAATGSDKSKLRGGLDPAFGIPILASLVCPPFSQPAR